VEHRISIARESILPIAMALLAAIILKLLPVLRSRRAAYAMGLLITSEAYLLAWHLHSYELPRELRLAILFAVVAQPVFFWLFSNELFDDRFRFRWWHGLVIGGKFVLAATLLFNRKITDIFGVISAEDYPRLIPNFFYTLGFVFHAVAVILRTNRSDLVEPRRRLRATVLIVTAVLILHALLSAAVLRPAGLGAYSDMFGLIFITAGAFASVAWGDSIWRELFASQKQSAASATLDADPEIMQKAIAAMEVDELFRTEGLTVTALAAKLDVQEYKLRRAINGGLGYRNFNEYLNFYRMRAAKNFLEAKENADYPLIHLALDLGYPSPAPFNRAFKEATGLAPGEYRKRAGVVKGVPAGARSDRQPSP
jgi:AraC-like DNA-binding protein